MTQAGGGPAAGPPPPIVVAKPGDERGLAAAFERMKGGVQPAGGGR
jgi:hypothetical protein